MSTPPESEYTQAEVLAPMEQAVIEAIEALPDFPGFSFRRWDELPCSHGGIDDGSYVNIEISYQFSEEFSSDPLIRENYVDALRKHWTALGYDIHRDQPSGTGKFYGLEAKRDDGINLWYRVLDIVSLKVQSGCVPRSDPSEIEYIAPAGGIAPGGEGDAVSRQDEYFPDGVPTDQLTTEAVDPFASGSASPGRRSLSSRRGTPRT